MSEAKKSKAAVGELALVIGAAYRVLSPQQWKVACDSLELLAKKAGVSQKTIDRILTPREHPWAGPKGRIE